MKINIEFEENPNFNYNPLMTFRFLKNKDSNGIAVFLNYFNEKIFNNTTTSYNNVDIFIENKRKSIKIKKITYYDNSYKYSITMKNNTIKTNSLICSLDLLKNDIKQLFDFFNNNPVNKPILPEPTIHWGSSYIFNKEEDKNVSNVIEKNALSLIKEINELNLIEKEDQNNKLKELNRLELEKFLTQEYGEFSIW